MREIFAYDSFAAFLGDLASSRGRRSGVKSELAAAMGSHPAYLSRALAGKAQLSAEQAERIAAHLRFGDEETRYVVFLLQEERAGTPELRALFRKERERIRARRATVKSRIPKSQRLADEERAVYYGAWWHAAVHVLASIPKFRDSEAIAKRLRLPEAAVRASVAFLQSAGVLRRAGDRWLPGERHLHLERRSPYLRQHHANWRAKAVQSLDHPASGDLRYTGVFSLSARDAEALRERMLRHLGEYLETVKDSAEERAYAYCFDFFEL